ncbi:hypothetical protein KJ925_00115 [Patescibacteria group bacterium]|nr:hypothetical protein [Patescibacteria group bacterium]
MELVIALSLKNKPLAIGLLNEGGGYDQQAVITAVNAARLHGRAQLFAQNPGDYEGVTADTKKSTSIARSDPATEE